MLISDMQKCEQTPGLSVYEHGLSVNRYYKDLKNHVLTGSPLEFEWVLPDWIYDKRIWDNQLDCIDTYQIFHDCGKPYCKVIDAEGKVHFQDHARISAEVWLKNGGTELEALLMASDMDIHLLKAVGVEEFSRRPEALTLLTTGLAEIHSNASMFGGIDSTSFKIKYKQINKRGKAILSLPCSSIG